MGSFMDWIKTATAALVLFGLLFAGYSYLDRTYAKDAVLAQLTTEFKMDQLNRRIERIEEMQWKFQQWYGPRLERARPEDRLQYQKLEQEKQMRQMELQKLLRK